MNNWKISSCLPSSPRAHTDVPNSSQNYICCGFSRWLWRKRLKRLRTFWWKWQQRISVDGTGHRRGIVDSTAGMEQRKCLLILTSIRLTNSLTQVIKTSCHICAQWDNKNTELSKLIAPHNCKINHIGSAGKLEPDGALRIFQRSKAQYDLQYMQYLGDDDSKVYTTVNSAGLYDKCYEYYIQIPINLSHFFKWKREIENTKSLMTQTTNQPRKQETPDDQWPHMIGWLEDSIKKRYWSWRWHAVNNYPPHQYFASLFTKPKRKRSIKEDYCRDSLVDDFYNQTSRSCRFGGAKLQSARIRKQHKIYHMCTHKCVLCPG